MKKILYFIILIGFVIGIYMEAGAFTAAGFLFLSLLTSAIAHKIQKRG